MTVMEILRKASYMLQVQALESPLLIEIGENTARRLNEEMRLILKYGSDRNAFAHNEAMIYGIKIVAPSNFTFTREIPSKEEWAR